jgi:hypothetical protein
MYKRILLTLAISLVGFTKAASAGDVFVEVNPQLFFMGGYGGAIGAEFSHIQIGLYGASTTLPDSFRDGFFNNAQNTKIKNSLVEIGFKLYLNPENQGFYAGVLYGPEWFQIQSNSTSSSQSIRADFLAGKFGYR